MHESIFHATQIYFNLYVPVDLFASSVNAELPKYFAYRGNPRDVFKGSFV